MVTRIEASVSQFIFSRPAGIEREGLSLIRLDFCYQGGSLVWCLGL